jgi:hypothetical protein
VDGAADDDELHAALLARGIQVAVAPWPQRPDGGPWRRVIRISAAPYVAIDDIARLADVLPSVIAGLAD